MGFSAAVKKILICNSKEWKERKIIRNFGNCWGWQKRTDSSCADNNLAAVKIQTAFRGYMARQMLISQRKRRTGLKSSIQGQQRLPQSKSSMPSLRHAVEMSGHLQPKAGAMRRRNPDNESEHIHPKPEIKIGRPRTSSMKKTFMDPDEPRWGWSWGQQRAGVHLEIDQRQDANRNQVVQECSGWSTSAKTGTHCQSFGSNSNSNSVRMKGYMASTVSSRAKCRSPKPTLLENSTRRRLLFIEDHPIHR